MAFDFLSSFPGYGYKYNVPTSHNRYRRSQHIQSASTGKACYEHTGPPLGYQERSQAYSQCQLSQRKKKPLHRAAVDIPLLFPDLTDPQSVFVSIPRLGIFSSRSILPKTRRYEIKPAFFLMFQTLHIHQSTHNQIIK